MLNARFTVAILALIAATTQSALADKHDVAGKTFQAIAQSLTDIQTLYFFDTLKRQQFFNLDMSEKNMGTAVGTMSEEAANVLQSFEQELMVIQNGEMFMDPKETPKYLEKVMLEVFAENVAEQAITPENRAWALRSFYSTYILLLVANAPHEMMAKVIRGGMFDNPNPQPEEPTLMDHLKTTGIYKENGPSLVDELKEQGKLTPEQYEHFKIRMDGNVMQLPKFMSDWSARIVEFYKNTKLGSVKPKAPAPVPGPPESEDPSEPTLPEPTPKNWV